MSATSYAAEIAAEYRESPEHHDAQPEATCHRCGDWYLEDELAEGLCPTCMASAHLVRCEGCGRVVPTSVAVSERETTRAGKVIAWSYCPCCHREAVCSRARELAS